MSALHFVLPVLAQGPVASDFTVNPGSRFSGVTKFGRSSSKRSGQSGRESTNPDYVLVSDNP